MVVIERGTSSFGAHFPDLPGCIAIGETREEALELIQEAIAFHLEDLREQVQPIPKPSSVGEFVSVAASQRFALQML